MTLEEYQTAISQWMKMHEKQVGETDENVKSILSAEWFENHPQTTTQGTYDGPWLSSDQYKALMNAMIECDSKSKNSIPPLVENKYHAGMTKEQCVEQFIKDAPHNPYEWDLHYLPEGGVMFYFSRECQFFFSIEEFKDFCKRIKDAERKYFASLNQRQ